MAVGHYRENGHGLWPQGKNLTAVLVDLSVVYSNHDRFFDTCSRAAAAAVTLYYKE